MGYRVMLNVPPKVDPRRFAELAKSDDSIVRDLLSDLRTARAIISIHRFTLSQLARAVRVGGYADLAQQAIGELEDPVAVVPCAHCGGELYDNALFDPKRNRSICPSCWQEPGA